MPHTTPYKQVIAHFKDVDPLIYQLTQVHEIAMPTVSTSLFSDLCDTIVSQQLSGKAAATLYSRFLTLFDGDITPLKVLSYRAEQIREKGISWAKSYSLLDLAQKVVDKQVMLENFETMSNEDVIKQLVTVKGIGQWSAEMTLMFSLGREDVFSFTDLGLQNAIMRLYGLAQKPTKQEITQLSEKWSPYRSYAAKLLWKSLDNR